MECLDIIAPLICLVISTAYVIWLAVVCCRYYYPLLREQGINETDCMSDEIKGAHKKADGGNDADRPPAPPIGIDKTPPEKEKTPDSEQETERKKRIADIATRRRRERRKRTAKIVIEFVLALAGSSATVAIAILTFFYVSYSREQWRTMEKQWAKMDETLRATNKLVESARLQTVATIKSTHVAQRGVKNQILAMKIAYRPRIFFTTIPPEPGITRMETGQGVLGKWSISYRNDGRGTATDLDFKAEVRTAKKPARPPGTDDPFNDMRGRPTAASPLALGDKGTFDYSGPLGTPIDDLLAIKDNMAAYSIQVAVWYKDEFGDTHCTSRCVIYPIEGGTDAMCAKGNFAR